MSAAETSPRELQREILRGVSRSFYISVRLLPKQLREPVALGYLLARATDTIADTASISWNLRAEQLHTLAAAIQGDETAAAQVADLVSAFAPLQTNRSERALVHVLPQCLAWLNRTHHRDDIRAVLATINRGQLLDLERFGSASHIVALANENELLEYMWLVAGCVGEFWTSLCFANIDNFCDRPREEMLELAKQYGSGLQLINILRDAGSDLGQGRCYFPQTEIEAAGIFPSQLPESPLAFGRIFSKWLEAAEHGVDAGLEYSLAINNRRVRAATVLPALIGARTLALLRAAGVAALHEKVKIPRREVRGIVGGVAITLADRRSLERMFRKLSGRGD